jgi:hypothetical protein
MSFVSLVRPPNARNSQIGSERLQTANDGRIQAEIRRQHLEPTHGDVLDNHPHEGKQSLARVPLRNRHNTKVEVEASPDRVEAVAGSSPRVIMDDRGRCRDDQPRQSQRHEEPQDQQNSLTPKTWGYEDHKCPNTDLLRRQRQEEPRKQTNIPDPNGMERPGAWALMLGPAPSPNGIRS